MTRIARIVALALPLLLIGVLVSAGGWRIHDGRVERVSQDSTSAAAPAVASAAAPSSTAPVDQMTFVRHLSPSVPWPGWVGLIVLCLLPAVASTLAWSGARRSRSRDSAFSAP